MATTTLELNSMFSDHMVLQRGREVPVWGKANPGEVVSVSCAGNETSAMAGADGRWQAMLGPMQAGGPHELRAAAGTHIARFRNVLVGDVWLCSGQSNMQWTVGDCAQPDKKTSRAKDCPNLRLYMVPKFGADAPRDRMQAQWRECSPAEVRGFSGVAYYFAREIMDSAPMRGVPVGLIDSSFGGTTVEAWMSRGELDARFAGEELRDSLFGFKPASMYNGMIAPVQPFALAGVLWYQGESNCSRPVQYARLFAGMIDQWRRDWQRDDLPFLFVQLPDFAEKFDGWHFTWLREAQQRVANEVPHTAMAVAIDAGDPYDVHPGEKREVARRLALLARRVVYGEDVVSSGPAFRSMSIEGGSVRVAFDSGGSGIAGKDGDEVRGFTVAGADGVFHNAGARIEGDALILRSPAVPEPVHVRHAWKGDPDAGLYNREGLPAAPFRTDSFPVEDLEVEQMPAPHLLSTAAYEVRVEGDGCVDHLAVAGKEFLAHELPFVRGAAFHTAWGPSRLFHVREEGPAILSTGNATGSVEYRFHPDRMEWKLRNASNEEMAFRITVTEDVESMDPVPPDAGKEPAQVSAVTLRRGRAVLEIGGIDKLTGRQGGGAVVETLVKPRGERVVGFVARVGDSATSSPSAAKKPAKAHWPKAGK